MEYQINQKCNDFEELMHQILSTCLKVENLLLHIKPHPQQDEFMLQKILSRYPQNRVEITNKSSITLIERAQFIISMPTGVIINALVMGKPVIEYFNYKKMNAALRQKYEKVPKGLLGCQVSLDNQGNLTSLYEKLNLVSVANTPEELESLLHRNLQKHRHEELTDIRTIFPDGACRKGAEAIMSML